MLGLGINAAVIIGGGLALSSTAFVLQLLVERGERATSFGLSTFSILLRQVLAVVPLTLLVILIGSEGCSIIQAFGITAWTGSYRSPACHWSWERFWQGCCWQKRSIGTRLKQIFGLFEGYVLACFS